MHLLLVLSPDLRLEEEVWLDTGRKDAFETIDAKDGSCQCQRDS